MQGRRCDGSREAEAVEDACRRFEPEDHERQHIVEVVADVMKELQEIQAADSAKW